MKVATGIVLLCLFAVVAETTTKAATVVKGTHNDIIMHDFSTTSITTGHTIPEGTTNKSTTSIPTTPATTTRRTIPETTKSLFTTTTTTTPLITTTTTTTITNSRLCQNGGSFDGIKCICPDAFFGTFCENSKDRFEFGKTVQTTVKVKLRFPNKNFTENLGNSQSNEYKEFEKEFKRDMNIVYKGVSGYRDVNILSIRPGSVIVDHEVMVDIEYNANITVTEQYNNLLQDVKKELNTIVCGKTIQTMINDCISDILTVTEGVPPKNQDDMCSSAVPPGFQEFYMPVITEGGLFCVSHCHHQSPRFTNCNEGTCQIERGTGPHCLCPYTDSYMYTKPQCTGKISKTVLLVSVGVTIGILLIVLVILVIFCFRRKTKAPKVLTEEEVYYSTIKG